MLFGHTKDLRSPPDREFAEFAAQRPQRPDRRGRAGSVLVL